MFRFALAAGIGAGLFLCVDVKAEESSRKLRVSDWMPALSVVDSRGTKYCYDPQTGGAILVLFYSPAKPQSVKAAQDIAHILQRLDSIPHKLAFLAVSDDPNTIDTIRLSETEKLTVHFVRDGNFELWGKFGVIASPTVFLAGRQGKIELIKPGYGYDFAPVIKSKIQEIMGLASKEDAASASLVRIVSNDSETQKADRHLKMAQLLAGKGDHEAALLQLKAAVQIDPNSTEAKLELARLYGITSDPNSAIEIALPLRPSEKRHLILHAMVLGNAYGQLNDFPNAEKYLLEAVALDPRNGRALYELGRIYQLQQKNDQALGTYRRSLDITYDSP